MLFPASFDCFAGQIVIVQSHMGQGQRSRGSGGQGQVGQGQLKAHDIGRWAHVNVKLHFCLFIQIQHRMH